MNKLRKLLKYVSLAGLLPSLLYLGSIGPVAKALGGAIEPDKGFYRTFYKPVERLAEATKCEAARKSYLKMWGVKPWYEKDEWSVKPITERAAQVERRLGVK